MKSFFWKTALIKQGSLPFLKGGFKDISSKMSKPRYQAYTMLILSLLTVSFFGAFPIRITLTTIAQLKREIEDKQDYSRKLTEKISRIAALKSDYEVIKGALPSVDAAVPENHEFNFFLADVHKTASQSGVVIKSLTLGGFPLISPAVSSSSAAFADIGFEITAAGQYGVLQAFSEKILRGPRYAGLADLIIEPVKESGTAVLAGQKLTLKLKGNIYYVPKP